MVRIRCVASSSWEGTPLLCSSPQLPNSSCTRAAWSHQDGNSFAMVYQKMQMIPQYNI